MTNIDVSIFWKNVTRELDERNCSYAQFADALGISCQSLASARYLQSALSLTTLIQIAYALNIRPSRLLGLKNCRMKFIDENDKNEHMLELMNSDSVAAIQTLISYLDENTQKLFMLRAKELCDKKDIK